MNNRKSCRKKWTSCNCDAAGIDAKLQKAQDDFVARMNVELPRIMDNYIKTRAPQIQKQAMQTDGALAPRPLKMPLSAGGHTILAAYVPLASRRSQLHPLPHGLQFHVEKLFSHEKFVAVGEFGFPAHAAINTVPAAQIL